MQLFAPEVVFAVLALQVSLRNIVVSCKLFCLVLLGIFLA